MSGQTGGGGETGGMGTDGERVRSNQRTQHETNCTTFLLWLETVSMATTSNAFTRKFAAFRLNLLETFLGKGPNRGYFPNPPSA